MNVELKDIRSKVKEVAIGTPKERSGVNRSKGGNVRGVSQKEIDKKRGILEHDFDNEITASDIQAQYAQVGISITSKEAEDIYDAVRNYSKDGYDAMIYAWRKNQSGAPLSSVEKRDLEQYRLCEEYLKVAPTFTYGSGNQQGEVYRGIYRGFNNEGIAYFNQVLSLKPGDKWNMEKRPTSLTSSFDMAQEFAGRQGAIIHVPVKKLKNSVSIVAISPSMSEQEVFSADYKWKIARISDERNKPDGFYHIYLK